MSGQPAIEPVTDEDTRVATQSYFINIKHILEQDRRRVAERQARSYNREKDCATADDWRHRSRHLEAEWGRCSQQCAVMQGERDAARAEVARLTAANKWRPIKTAPKDGTVILIHVPNARLPSMARADDLLAKPYWLEGASHWMPLPEPPK